MISHIKKFKVGVPLWHSRLRIRHCHCSGLGSSCHEGLIPGMGTSICRGGGQKKKKKKFRSYTIKVKLSLMLLPDQCLDYLTESQEVKSYMGNSSR